MIISVPLHVFPSLEYPVSNFKLIMSAESSVRSRGLWPASMRLKSAASADPVSPPPPAACLLSHLHYFAAWPCHREVGSGLHLDKSWGISCQVDGSLGDAGQSHYPIIPQSSCPQSLPAQAPWQDCVVALQMFRYWMCLLFMLALSPLISSLWVFWTISLKRWWSKTLLETRVILLNTLCLPVPNYALGLCAVPGF